MNPFRINIEDKESYTVEDYKEIQRKLREKIDDVKNLANSLYPTNYELREKKENLTDFLTKCLKQNFLIEESDNYPLEHLIKIGDGGDNKSCIVTCSIYPVINKNDTSHISNLVKKIPHQLAKVGYNGSFLWFEGKYPNPTGKEMKFAGVPYAFKIFMMLEAYKRGFTKVIWIDSACYPLNSPKPLFDELEKRDAIFQIFDENFFGNNSEFMYPKTYEILNNFTGRNVSQGLKVNSIVFGLNMESKDVKSFISEYYELVTLGLPFLSRFPEEIVFTSLFNQPKYQHFFHNMPYNNKFYVHEGHYDKNMARINGYFFSQLCHNSMN
jgi:hypothetical protein